MAAVAVGGGDGGDATAGADVDDSVGEFNDGVVFVAGARPKITSTIYINQFVLNHLYIFGIYDLLLHQNQLLRIAYLLLLWLKMRWVLLFVVLVEFVVWLAVMQTARLMFWIEPHSMLHLVVDMVFLLIDVARELTRFFWLS